MTSIINVLLFNYNKNPCQNPAFVLGLGVVKTPATGSGKFKWRLATNKEEVVRHGNVRFAEVFRLLDAAAAISGQVVEEPECPPVFGGDTLGQAGALYQKVPSNIREALLRDEVKLVMEEPTRVVVHRQEQLMVDTDGRFIFRNIPQVVPPNWGLGFDRSIQPTYPEVLERLKYALKRPIEISVAEFQDRAERRKAAIWDNLLYGNLFKGRYVRPFAIALPQMQVPKKGGLGEALARIIVPAAERGYLHQYPARKFNDCRGDSLISQTVSFPASRQERLIAALAEGPQVLWVFLNCLQGASINAAKALIQTLPEEFILGGTLVNAPVIAAYPEIAAASNKNPLYFCAADIFLHGDSLYLLPRDDSLIFGRWLDLGRCSGNYSASVAVLA